MGVWIRIMFAPVGVLCIVLSTYETIEPLIFKFSKNRNELEGHIILQGFKERLRDESRAW